MEVVGGGAEANQMHHYIPWSFLATCTHTQNVPCTQVPEVKKGLGDVAGDTLCLDCAILRVPLTEVTDNNRLVFSLPPFNQVCPHPT